MKKYFGLSEIISIISKKNLIYLVFSIIFTIVLTIMEILSLSMIVPLMDLVLNQESESKIYQSLINNSRFEKFYSLENILVIFVILYFIKTIFSIFISFFNQTCYLKVAFYVKNKLLKNYLDMDYSKFLKRNSSEMLVNVDKTSSLFAFNFLGSIISIFSEILLFLVILILLLFHDLNKTLFIMTMFLSFGLFYSLITQKKIRDMGSKAVRFNQLTTIYLNEIFKGLKFIKINRKMDMYVNQINSIILNNLKIERNLSILSAIPRVSMEFITVFLFALLVIFFKNQGDLNFISTMSLYVVAAMRIIPSMSKILQSIQNYKYGRESLSVLKNDLFDNKKLVSKITSSTYEEISEFNDEIELKDVSFSYSVHSKNVLNKLNFSMKKNDKIVLLGESGSGKSTLIDIILGFLKPTNGYISIDKKNFTNKRFNLNKIVGYVPQKTFLFDDTIEKNISLEFNEAKIDNSKLYKSVKKSELIDFINNKENKYKSKIGDDGSLVSGGQKQRISIARALYKNPDILIFDEATNSLDEKTEIEIIKSILSFKEKTIIFITHNRNLIKYFKKVFDLNKYN